jgi:Zn-dependent metalloprotease
MSLVKLIICSLLFTTAIAASSMSMALAAPLSSKARAELDMLQLMAAHTLQIQWNEETSSPRQIVGTLSERSNHSPEWISLRWVAKYRSLYGSRSPYTEYIVISRDEREDYTWVRLQQTVHSIPVLGNELDIEIDRSGVIRRVEGSLVPEVEKAVFHHPLKPFITEEQAVTIARQHIPGMENGPLRAQRYIMPSHPGTPVVYVVTWQSRRIIIHGMTGWIIGEFIASGAQTNNR